MKTSGRFKRFRDLYCVVEVDHVHKARTVVRSGGLNFDWDEKFQLDLLNNLEVEFLIYSWDPQLRHRLCYRTSLRLGALFSGKKLRWTFSASSNMYIFIFVSFIHMFRCSSSYLNKNH